MRLARVAKDTEKYVGLIDGEQVLLLRDEAGWPYADAMRELATDGVDVAAMEPRDVLRTDEVRLLAPLSNPQKIIAIGLNYADHVREAGMEPPETPVAFAKLPSSIIGPEEAIRYRRRDSQQVDYEAELAVVIGRRARHVSVESALEYVFGYTACNDVSARDAQFADGQWVRGKSFDTFCPLGPWIVTADEVGDPQSLAIRCLVNGETLQESSTKEMVFGVADIVSYLSRFITLEPGDVIATGTPFGVGFARTPPVYLADGDVVEVDIERIGTLRNPVVVDD